MTINVTTLSQIKDTSPWSIHGLHQPMPLLEKPRPINVTKAAVRLTKAQRASNAIKNIFWPQFAARPLDHYNAWRTL
jgi:hypothetical protein